VQRLKEIERAREESKKQRAERAITDLSATLAAQLNKLDEQVEVLSPSSVPQLSNRIEEPNIHALSLVEPQGPMRAESRDPEVPDTAIRPYYGARGKLAGWVMPGGLLTGGEEWISWLPVRRECLSAAPHSHVEPFSPPHMPPAPRKRLSPPANRAPRRALPNQMSSIAGA
jgi:hypothetical protein